MATAWLAWRLMLWLGIRFLDLFIAVLRGVAGVAGFADPLRKSLHPRQ